MTVMRDGNRLTIVAFILLLIVVIPCLFAGSFQGMLGIDGKAVNVFDRFSAPSADHWLGTDHLGRDVFARLLEGGRVSILVAFVGTALATLFGAVFGLTAAMLGGTGDRILMRLTDIALSLPALPILIVLSAVDISRFINPQIIPEDYLPISQLALLIAIFSWPTMARLVRSTALSIKQQDYVLSAKSLGCSYVGIALRHILPAVQPVIIVSFCIGIGHAMIAEASLSFLGLGIQPPIPSWGNMLSNTWESLWKAPLTALVPGICIFAVISLVTAMAESLDPNRRAPNSQC